MTPNEAARCSLSAVEDRDRESVVLVTDGSRKDTKRYFCCSVPLFLIAFAVTVPIFNIVYMLCAKYGFVQSTDCAAQTMDPYFARQSMDYARNPWII